MEPFSSFKNNKIPHLFNSLLLVAGEEWQMQVTLMHYRFFSYSGNTMEIG
jgi:hypothetical protein